MVSLLLVIQTIIYTLETSKYLLLSNKIEAIFSLLFKF